jgi:recombination associated protein RdgC
MWFRNLQTFRLADEWNFTSAALTERLGRKVFRHCGATEMQSLGWTPPRGEPDELVVAVDRQQLIALSIEQKLLPGSVVRQYAAERLAALEASQGFPPGRKQAMEMRELVTLELLPRAFVKRRLTYLWIDPVGRWLVTDAASPAKADEAIELLKDSLDALPLHLVRTQLSPGAAMTGWLAAGEAPAGFSIDRDCELRSSSEERATVRYARHSLDEDEVRGHIATGKAATRLALTWNDRVSFILTEQMQIKRVAFLDILKEEAGRRVEAGDDLFEANFTLMSGELTRLIADLVEALGGEAE